MFQSVTNSKNMTWLYCNFCKKCEVPRSLSFKAFGK